MNPPASSDRNTVIHRHPCSALAERLEESMKDNADMKSEMLLTRQRMKELERQNLIDRDALLAKIEQ